MPKKGKTPGGKRRLPPINGPQLAKLLVKDRWQAGRMATHGQVYTKLIDDRIRVTVIPVRRDPLPGGTLAHILLQTGVTKDGLRALIDEHGL